MLNFQRDFAISATRLVRTEDNYPGRPALLEPPPPPPLSFLFIINFKCKQALSCTQLSAICCLKYCEMGKFRCPSSRAAERSAVLLCPAGVMSPLQAVHQPEDGVHKGDSPSGSRRWRSCSICQNFDLIHKTFEETSLKMRCRTEGVRESGRSSSPSLSLWGGGSALIVSSCLVESSASRPREHQREWLE